MTTTAALFDELGEPLPDAEIIPPPDHGCDWVRIDRRFSRCVTCPLARCRMDWGEREQQAIGVIVERALRGIPPAATPARPRQRERWMLHRVLMDVITTH